MIPKVKIPPKRGRELYSKVGDYLLLLLPYATNISELKIGRGQKGMHGAVTSLYDYKIFMY